MIEMAEQEITAEQALTGALVATMKALTDQGHDLYDLIEQLPFTLDEKLIHEMDRQGISWA